MEETKTEETTTEKMLSVIIFKLFRMEEKIDQMKTEIENSQFEKEIYANSVDNLQYQLEQNLEQSFELMETLQTVYFNKFSHK